MFAKRSKLTIIGAIMIIIQLISIISVSFSVAGLYPEHDHLVQDGYLYDYHPTDFRIEMAPIALSAGIEKFVSSFGEIFAVNDDGNLLSDTQHKSAVNRGALYHGSGLYIYDLILTISYSIVGIVGLGLLVAGIIVERRNLRKSQQLVEDIDTASCESPIEN